MRIRVSATTRAPLDAAWLALADISSHVEWMLDAEAISFVGDQREGVGTAFDCRTRVGPIALLDHMVVTRWDRGHAIGVSHRGLVAGEGLFELRAGDDRSVIVWTEDLAFPTRLGGVVTTWLARPVLKAIWKGNLRRLAARLDAPYR